MEQTTNSGGAACENFLARLELWLADELSADQHAAMQAHHDACAACQLDTRLARRITAITAALPAPLCPPLTTPFSADRDRRRAGYRQHQRRARALLTQFLGTWRQPLVFAPALVLVLLAVLLVQFRLTDTLVDPDIVIIDGQRYTRDEIVRATEDLELALRYLDKYGSYPARVVQAELEQSHLPLPPPRTADNNPSI